MVPGDIFVVCCENGYNDSAGAGGEAYLGLDTNTGGTSLDCKVEYQGLSADKMTPNHIYFMMAHVTSSIPRLHFKSWGAAGGTAFTSFCRKITDFHNNPGVYYHIKFEEVYENASDVTTTADVEWSDCGLFVPAQVRAGESFSDFLQAFPGGKKNLSRAEDSFFKPDQGFELRVLTLAVGAYIRSKVVGDFGSYQKNDLPNVGWGMFTVNDVSAPGFDSGDETVSVGIDCIINGGGIIYSGAYTVVPMEQRCFPNMKLVNFVGALGDEQFLFRGLHTESGQAEKTYYKNLNRIRKVLNAFKRTRLKLRTLVETQAARRLLHEMTYTEQDVWMYDEDETSGYKEVTVIDDNVIVGDRNELFESSIDIEYYE